MESIHAMSEVVVALVVLAVCAVIYGMYLRSKNKWSQEKRQLWGFIDKEDARTKLAVAQEVKKVYDSEGNQVYPCANCCTESGEKLQQCNSVSELVQGLDISEESKTDILRALQV